MRKGFFAVTVAALALVSFMGCSDSGPSGPADTSLVGTWQFLQKFTINGSLIDTLNASDSVSGSYVFRADSTFTNIYDYAFSSPATLNGTWNVKGDSLTLNMLPLLVTKYTYAVSGSTLALTSTYEVASVLFIVIEKYRRL